MSGTHETKLFRAARAPLDDRHQRCKQSKRRRWESNPLDAALQAAATPCDFSVLEISIFDCGFSIDQTTGSHPNRQSKIENQKYPSHQLAVFSDPQPSTLHPHAPPRSRTSPGSFEDCHASTTLAGRADSNTKSRRLDSRQYQPVYKTGAFLSRATSAGGTSARFRTSASRWQVRELHPTGWAYEARLDSGPPASVIVFSVQ